MPGKEQCLGDVLNPKAAKVSRAAKVASGGGSCSSGGCLSKALGWSHFCSPTCSHPAGTWPHTGLPSGPQTRTSHHCEWSSRGVRKGLLPPCLLGIPCRSFTVMALPVAVDTKASVLAANPGPHTAPTSPVCFLPPATGLWFSCPSSLVSTLAILSSSDINDCLPL